MKGEGDQRWPPTTAFALLFFLQVVFLQGLCECNPSSPTCQLLDTVFPPPAPQSCLLPLKCLSAPAVHPSSSLESLLAPPVLAACQHAVLGNCYLFICRDTPSSPRVDTVSCPQLTASLYSPSAGRVRFFTFLTWPGPPLYPESLLPLDPQTSPPLTRAGLGSS